jgi:hypothetical protein
MLPCGHRSGLLRGRLVNYKDLEELDALMAKRDHYALEKRGAEPLIWNELADSVPALVAEVRRLNLQNRELVDALLHMKSCGGCAEDSWLSCEGGRAALAALEKTKPEKPKHDHTTSPCPRCGTVQPDVDKRIDERK